MEERVGRQCRVCDGQIIVQKKHGSGLCSSRHKAAANTSNTSTKPQAKYLPRRVLLLYVKAPLVRDREKRESGGVKKMDQ
jgi:hypothetical protein